MKLPDDWRQRARKALDNWAPNAETSVAVELKVAFRDGIRHAAKFVEERGDRDLAMAIRRLAEERQDRL